MSSLGRNEVTYKSSVLLLAKIKHGCGLVSPAISVPKDKYDMQQIQRCMILFFQFLNNFLCGFASSFYQNIHCGTLLWEKHQLPADHQAGWPLCKLWEHRFPVPDLACTPPPPPPAREYDPRTLYAHASIWSIEVSQRHFIWIVYVHCEHLQAVFLELNDVYWKLRSTNVFFEVSRYFSAESEFIVASLSPLRGQSFLSWNSTSKTRWRLNVV